MASPSALLALIWLGMIWLLASAESFLVHETRESIPHGWTRGDKISHDLRIPIRIALTPRNVDKGHDFLMDVSDPVSPRYGQHWSAEQVYSTFAPDLETLSAVQNWLSSCGVSRSRQSVASSRSYVSFEGSIVEAESLFLAEYHFWEHKSGALTIATDEYSLPIELKSHIDFVSPGTGLHKSKASRKELGQKSSSRLSKRSLLSHKKPSASKNCSTYVTPTCIQQVYNISLPQHAQKGNDIGVFENHAGYNQSLLNAFFSHLAPYIPSGTHPIANSIDGGAFEVIAIEADPEATSDLDVIYPLVYPQAVRYLSVLAPDSPATNGFLDVFLDAIDPSYCTSPGSKNKVDPHFPNKYWNHSAECGIYQPPNVISLSYEPVGATPAAYRMRQCHEYLKLGLQGVSLIFASGDFGALPVAGGCGTGAPIVTTFPADCPYVLSVGATKIGTTLSDPEQAASADKGGFTSGGGFSSLFSRPPWQNTAIQQFFNLSKHHLPSASSYNASNRGFPDVSAVGQDIVIYEPPKYTTPQTQDDYMPMTVSGTSAAAPLVASLITRINALRLARGKKALGFLNPAFYAHPQMFTDVMIGRNNGCRNNSTGKFEPAFSCVQGWDPVTGLGTPIFPRMAEYLTSLK